MKSVSLAYGRTGQTLNLPPEIRGEIIESDYPFTRQSLEDLTVQALSHPLESPPLGELVKQGETVCLVFSDITRSWQQTGRYLPLIIHELEMAGIRKEDITLLCALGTHRPHREEEKKLLLGELYGKYVMVDHDCDDRDNLIYKGTTSRGTPVEINRLADEADHLILTGAVVFHLMAGYSGGRKSLVPGIASRKTIMANHSLSLSPEPGKGSHPDIGCDKLENNPLHEDLEEALDLINPSFLVNIVPGKDRPAAVVAGHCRRAHQKACSLLRDFFLVPIREKRELVIASAGGFPGDINFYQSVKSLINASQALKEGGTLILVSQCSEGLGNPLMEEMLSRFASMAEREAFLRGNYTIGRFIAYFGCELASRFRVILVSETDEPSLARADILRVSTLDEALDAFRSREESRPLSAWILPDGAHTFPAVPMGTSY